MAKISTFIIGLMVSSLFITLLAIFIGHISVNYGLSYDNSSFTAYNKLAELTNQSNTIKAEVENLKSSSNLLDIIGGFFSDGYQALKLSINSLNIFQDMSNQAVKDLNIGESGEYIRTVLTGIVVVMLIIGVLISALVNRDL